MLIAMLSALPVLAYAPPVVDDALEGEEYDAGIEANEDMTEEFFVEDVYIDEIIAQDETDFPDAGYSPTSDEYFIDENGVLYNIEESSGVSNRKVCKHVYLKGTYIKHAKKAGGGCTKSYYDCKCCKKCDVKKEMKRIQTVSYKVCRH